MPYNLTLKWNLINKTNRKENITRDIEIKSKQAVSRGEMRGHNGGKGEGIMGRKEGGNNSKGYIDKTKGGGWNQVSEVGITGVRGRGGGTMQTIVFEQQ